MVRGFGLLLVVGVVIAFLCALTAGSAALVLADRRAPGHGRRRTRRRVGAGAARLGAAWRGARELLLDNPVNRFVGRVALVEAPRRPGRVLCVGLALAVLGWGLDTQTHVETNIEKLVPQNLESLQNLDALERATGVGGQLDLMVSAKDLTKPATIEWMSSYESAMLKRFGYSAIAGLRAGAAVPGVLAAGPVRGQACHDREDAPKLTQAEVQGLLDAIPPYFSQDVITPDRRTATLAFGIRLMSLAEQQQLIETMRSSLHPPAGVSAQLVGLPVLAAQSGTQVASPWRRLETLLIGLAAVALVLLDRLPRRPPPGARAARADRAGDGMVRAGPVRGEGAAEPDVGHAGRAGDRDLDRVQRAAVRALPPGAACGGRTRSRRCAAPTRARAPRSRPRG